MELSIKTKRFELTYGLTISTSVSAHGKPIGTLCAHSPSGRPYDHTR